MRVLVSFILFFCVASQANAQQSISADSLVFAIAEMYKDLGDYHFEGDVSVRMRRGRQSQTTGYKLRTAQELPSKYMIRLGGERARELVINDTMTWAHHPESRQYMKRPGTLLPVSLRSDFPNPISTYARLDELAESATVIELDTTYEIGGEVRPSYLLEVIPKPTDQTAGQSVSMILWVDRANLGVLQERRSSYIPNSPYGPMSVRQTTSYSTAMLNQDIPDSLFVFAPPDSTDRVTHIDAFPKIPLTLYGLPAKNFSLIELKQQEEVSLENYSNSVVVVNFWATWCGPCRAEMDALNTIYNERKNDGLVVLAINEEETPEQVTSYIEAGGFDFTVMLDQFGLVSREYNVYELPTTFIIDRNGVIQHHWIGARNEADFRHAVEKWIE